MANTLKIKRGAAATIPQGQLAEPLFTTDTYDLYIGKGSGGNQRIQNYIASGTSSQFLKGDGTLDSTTYQATSEKGQNNGYASLDAGGKIPASQLPSSVIEYKGTWNASTNTPTLADGTGDAGDVYIVSVGGTQNLGSGSITFDAGDWVMYNGSIWQKSTGSNAVASVNGQTGIVSIGVNDLDDATITSPSNGQLLQYSTGTNKWINWTPTYISAAITSLNGLTGATQTFATGTTGTDFGINSSGSIHTFNLPTASATNRGALSSADWTTFNNKQNALTNPVTGTGTNNQIAYFNTTGSTIASLDTATYPSLTELSYVKGVTSAIQTQLNAKEPTVTKGNLTETTSSVLTITGGTGAVIGSGTTIAVASAGAAQAGVVTTGSQTFAGDKTFSGTTAAVNVNLSGDISVTDGNDIKFNGPSDLNWRIYRAETAGFTKTLALAATLNLNSHYGGTGEGFAIGAQGGSSYYEIKGSSGTTPEHFFRGYVGIGGIPNTSYALTVSGASYFSTNITSAGSLTATAFIPTGSSVPTNGMYLSAANTLSLSTNSTRAITISDGQKVGIGADPISAYRLYVNGDIYASATVYGSSASFVGTGTFGSTVTATAFIPTGSSIPTNGMYLSAANTLNFATNSGSRLSISSTGAATFSSSVAATSLSLNGAIANSGDAATLTIKQSSTTYTNGIYLERGGERNGYYMYIGGSLDSLTFRRNYFGTQSDVMSLTRDGNVGIGTTSPSWMLELNKDTSSGSFGQYPAISVNNPNAAGYTAYYFFSGATNKAGIEYSNSTNALSIFGNGAERMRITSGGAVQATNNLTANSPSGGNTGEGIIVGTSFKIDATGTGQKAKMYVVSKDLSDTYGSGLQIQFANQADNKGFGFNLNTGGDYETYVKNASNSWVRSFRVLQSGRVNFDNICGINDVEFRWRGTTDGNHATVYDGTTNGPITFGYAGAALGYNPGVGASTRIIWTNNTNYYNYGNTTTWNTTSDIRIKENIKPIESSLSTLLKLNPVSFDYKSEYADYMKWNDDYKLNNIGFIAQEWEKVFPDYMDVSKVKLGDKEINDLKNIDTSVLMPLVIKAIQELNAKIDAK